jgi:hypothetical protein
MADIGRITRTKPVWPTNPKRHQEKKDQPEEEKPAPEVQKEESTENEEIKHIDEHV